MKRIKSKIGTHKFKADINVVGFDLYIIIATTFERNNMVGFEYRGRMFSDIYRKQP